MPATAAKINPAEAAAGEALMSMFDCIKARKNFRLEAGAGAGKTYSLVKALQYVIAEMGKDLGRRSQLIACITYTNVASDQITAQVDSHPVVHSSTIHSFCWTLISGFQPYLRAKLAELGEWTERLEEIGGIGSRMVAYDLGHPRARPEDDCVYLGHNDVLGLMVQMMEVEKFRNILKARFPIIFIDEYQDTNTDFAASLVEHFIATNTGPLVGLFGDSWQKIYGDGCGLIEHSHLQVIGKKANFRSVQPIVDVLNGMRPDLPQYVKDPESTGTVAVYHTNGWQGQRQKGQHWGGDLPAADASTHLEKLVELLKKDDWDFSPDATKILMLTHNVLAAKQGYSGIAKSFKYKDAFAKKESPHIKFLVDLVEPVVRAYEAKRYGEMFFLLGKPSLDVHSLTDKKVRAGKLDKLLELRKDGSIGAVIDYLSKSACPPLSETVAEAEEMLSKASAEEIKESRAMTEAARLRECPYSELITLADYLNDHTPFSTKHGVKGEEFENVLVVCGRGWNQYNWNAFLEWTNGSVPTDKIKAYERNRNLFYVACSRPKRRLALLFTQELSTTALTQLSAWFGDECVRPLG
jgi:DNA helicase-2/ATP-dependent DNA helicase PcrA